MKKSLRFWILSLISCMLFVILGSTFISAHYVTKQNMTEKTLEINRVYSEKLAQLTDEVFKAMTASLESRTQDIGEAIEDVDVLGGKLDRLLLSNEYFNTIAVVDENGVVVTSAPRIGLEGKQLTSIGAKEALEKRRTLISSPYQGITGDLLVLISTPLKGPNDEYIGFLAGTIYLQENNILRTVLGEHYARDGSYVYVIDEAGTLIYHPETYRIGETVTGNAVIEKLRVGESGSQMVTNSQGVNMLAGYTYIPSSKWGVVSQTPGETIITPVWMIVGKMLLYSLPFVIFIFIIAWILTNKIADPLRKLALYFFRQAYFKEKQEKPVIPTWYFEAEQLNRTIEEYVMQQEGTIRNFKEQSLTDPLTGLANRRHLERKLARWSEQKDFFSLLIIDIDYFKQINDTFGHPVGDKVLMFLAEKIKAIPVEGAFHARYGGEEFVVLLPNLNAKQALQISEDMRITISHTLSPTGAAITVSVGVGSYTDKEEEISSLISRVDQALYQAKQQGRNKSKLADEHGL